jgi:hypothetical protein
MQITTANGAVASRRKERRGPNDERSRQCCAVGWPEPRRSRQERHRHSPVPLGGQTRSLTGKRGQADARTQTAGFRRAVPRPVPQVTAYVRGPAGRDLRRWRDPDSNRERRVTDRSSSVPTVPAVPADKRPGLIGRCIRYQAGTTSVCGPATDRRRLRAAGQRGVAVEQPAKGSLNVVGEPSRAC